MSEPLSLRQRASDFVTLAKPGIALMVLVSTAAGWFIGARGRIDAWSLFDVLLGTLLTAAAANAINMAMEVDTDKLMKRTAGRPLPAGRMHPSTAVAFRVRVVHRGSGVADREGHTLTAVLAAMTVLSYLFIYTPLKRRTPLSTVVGAFPGALPPLIGWAAATGTLNFDAWMMFAIQFFWQMPHFFAIAWRLRDDYTAAGFPLLDRDRSRRGADRPADRVPVAGAAGRVADPGDAGPVRRDLFQRGARDGDRVSGARDAVCDGADDGECEAGFLGEHPVSSGAAGVAGGEGVAVGVKTAG